MLTHHKQLSPFCKHRSTKIDRIWTQLRNPNHWIFAFKYEETLSVECGSKIHTTILKGVGLMKLEADCVITQPNMIINAHNYYSSKSTAPFLPKIDSSLFVHTVLIEPLEEELHKEEIIIRRE